MTKTEKDAIKTLARILPTLMKMVDRDEKHISNIDYDDELITLKQLASLSKVHYWTMVRWSNKVSFPCVYVGRRKRYYKRRCIEMIAQNQLCAIE